MREAGYRAAHCFTITPHPSLKTLTLAAQAPLPPPASSPLSHHDPRRNRCQGARARRTHQSPRRPRSHSYLADRGKHHRQPQRRRTNRQRRHHPKPQPQPHHHRTKPTHIHSQPFFLCTLHQNPCSYYSQPHRRPLHQLEGTLPGCARPLRAHCPRPL